MVGVELLCNQSQQDTYMRLPDQFTFKEAKQAYDRGDQATTDFLEKCRAKGMLQSRGRVITKPVTPLRNVGTVPTYFAHRFTQELREQKAIESARTFSKVLAVSIPETLVRG